VYETGKDLQTASEAPGGAETHMASRPGGNNLDRDLRVPAGAGNSDRAAVDGDVSEPVQVAAKQDPGILIGQNSTDSEQSGLWTQRDGSVRATVFEGEKPPRQVVVPKKSPGNFDQSKIEPGILTNQKSRRGRPRNPNMPPVPGKYYYWKRDGNGLSLSYEPPLKNAKGKRIGQDYQYQGFLLPTDWEHLKGKFDEQTILSKIRAVLKIKRFRTLQRRKNRGAVAAKRGEPGRSAEAG
jgi:hypothetical protein